MVKKMTSIGGQAIIEGVMMRGPKKIAMAVRKPDGEIIIEEKEAKGIGKWAKMPILRGIVSFVSSMVTGVQALMFSAKFFDIEDEEDEKKKNSAKKKEKHSKEKSKNENGLSDTALYFTVFLSLMFSVGLFILLPNFIADLIVPTGMMMLYNIVENLVKILLFIVYLVLVSKMEDIQRLFQYHGAEHKSIFCYENGEELTVENVKKHSRFHPRCGTSFLLFVLIISIIFFSFLPRAESLAKILNVLINMGARLLLMPLVAGISYEVIKFAGKSKNKFVQMLNKPGMWLQRLTTKEPDESQIEVAIASLKAVIPENGEEDKW